MLRWIAQAATRSFYRLRVEGPRPPKTGPVLLVANHPNSLFDPALVLATAGRRVRFLAKAPLFDDWRVAWIVKSAGAIPVYRRVDDPAAMGGNDSMFRAVEEALEAGSAIGLFPEGRSHSEPSMSELRTGAARMALAAAKKTGRGFPIVPVGLVFRSKEVFRSSAAVVMGSPVEWADLAGRGAEDRDAVRELTGRIDEELRRVTVNLETWQDRPLVEGAVEIWSTERGDGPRVEATEEERVRRLAIATDLLRSARESGDVPTKLLVERLREHVDRLERFSLTPRSLLSRTQARVAAAWAARRLYLLGLPMLLFAALGWLLFRIPNSLTGRLAARTSPNETELATHKLVLGLLLNAFWLLLWCVAVGLAFGLWWTLGVAAALPVIGSLGSWVRQRWQGALDDARRFVFLRSRGDLVSSLRAAQSDLAEELEALVASR
ncbi:MAG: 1-acyl-sn-glycerol-3-phosphate acyltransferase [Acidobacteriota bacterium]